MATNYPIELFIHILNSEYMTTLVTLALDKLGQNFRNLF